MTSSKSRKQNDDFQKNYEFSFQWRVLRDFFQWWVFFFGSKFCSLTEFCVVEFLFQGVFLLYVFSATSLAWNSFVLLFQWRILFFRGTSFFRVSSIFFFSDFFFPGTSLVWYFPWVRTTNGDSKWVLFSRFYIVRVWVSGFRFSLGVRVGLGFRV